MDCAKAPPGVRKVKKNQVKNELDRIKQAEKKKRRLEKALATSAAIRSELEKKKQKKKEEQERLDEEGAAIAEAVALHVLLGEDSDDSRNVMMSKNEGLNSWDCGSNFDIFAHGGEPMVPLQDITSCSLHNGWVPHTLTGGYMWSDGGNMEWMVSSAEPYCTENLSHYYNHGGWEAAGLVAAQAVSSLKIAEEVRIDPYVMNRLI